jgi:hypothetical protein
MPSQDGGRAAGFFFGFSTIPGELPVFRARQNAKSFLQNAAVPACVATIQRPPGNFHAPTPWPNAFAQADASDEDGICLVPGTAKAAERPGTGNRTKD